LPNIKSVKKDVIKSRKNHERNIAAKSAAKTYVKKARTAIDAVKTDSAAAVEALRLACKTLDKTAERGIIHKNQAARRKSRLMKRLNKATQADG
jgi:small subunit ribosomal protein S20